MKKGNPAPLPPELEAELEALAARPDSKIDLTDPECPEVTDWSGGIRGALFRPIKKPVAMRLDAEGAIQSDVAYFGNSAIGGISTDGDSENEWRSSVCVS